MNRARPAADSFSLVVEDLMSAIEAETPSIGHELACELSSVTLHFAVGNERFVLGPEGVDRPGPVATAGRHDPNIGATEGSGSDHHGSSSTRDDGTTDVSIATDTSTVRSLVDGELDVVVAAREIASFDVVGSPPGLDVADRVVQLLVLGATRSTIAGALHRRIVTLCSDSTPPGEAT